MIENKTTEFKREYIDDIKYTVVAFANTEGGKIYIGMSDDGSVYGVENTCCCLTSASIPLNWPYLMEARKAFFVTARN